MDRPLDPTEPVASKSGSLTLMIVRDQQVDWKPLVAPCRLVVGRDPECDLTIDDRSLSRRHAVITLDPDGATVADLGSSNGTIVGSTPLTPDEPCPLSLDEMIELGSTVLVLRRMLGGAAAVATPMARVRALARQAASDSVDVCLVGEAGTGKRTLAERIHADSPSTTPMTVHTAQALDDTTIAQLADSEDTRLILHVTQTPRALQGALANALERRKGRTLLTSRVEPASLLAGRQIERALARACDTLLLVVPPLRICGAELGTLATECLAEEGRSFSPPRTFTLSDAAKNWLMARAWVGNLGELQQTMQRAARLADGETIERAHLDGDFGELSREDREKQRILDALTACAGNQTAAARMLRMSRRSLVYRLDKYGIPRPRKGG